VDRRIFGIINLNLKRHPVFVCEMIEFFVISNEAQRGEKSLFKEISPFSRNDKRTSRFKEK
jgi:hypothetical protein